jgi:inhibitor of KinA
VGGTGTLAADIMHLTALGDQAVLARFPTEAEALAFAAAVRAANWFEVLDVVPAYFTVAVYYDLGRIRQAELAPRLQSLNLNDSSAVAVGRLHVIPCCYNLGPDLDQVAERAKLSPAEVIALHSGTEYTVYAIGFCPGFPYLGYLPEALCGQPRLPSPRLRVPPGSVGLTGRQTGIYPLERPGGWNLIGRTPLELVNVVDGYFPLRAGNRVRFTAIDKAEFERLKGQRL